MNRNFVTRVVCLAGWVILVWAVFFAIPNQAVPRASQAQDRIPSPEGVFGHRIGADRKLVRWDGIVGYMKRVAEASDRVAVFEIGKTTQGRPFILVVVSSPETVKNLDYYRQLQRRLYFQDHQPGQDPDRVHTPEQRLELFEKGKTVVLVTCTIHSTEVGAAQMSLELVHRLATENSPRVQKILDNVLFLLVPSLNPDGQAMVVDWYNAYVGTRHEGAPLPWLYHPYVGHDNNRDMYMYTQQETRLIGKVLYRDWFPTIWLDEHQMGAMGPRIFVMPATDPINLNVHPLIYRLNGFYGQAQAAALEAAGKVGIIYDYVYTNFWEGAMAWTGWWHNQVGMLTEVASVRIATPVEQKKAELGKPPAGPPLSFREVRRRLWEHPEEPLPPPRDVQPRTTYPRPWLGGRWTLRDIVDYELVATMALLEAAADSRRSLLEQVYEINRTTIQQFMKGNESRAGEKKPGGYPTFPPTLEPQRPVTGRVLAGFDGAAGTPYAVLIPANQHDPGSVRALVRILQLGGIHVEQARQAFHAGDREYPAGTYVIRLAQVFGRYAKDLLEPQTYPEVRLAPELPPRAPYDVTAWSLGMQMGVETVFVDKPFEVELEPATPVPQGRIHGRGRYFLVDSRYTDAFALVNRLWGRIRRMRRVVQPIVGSPDKKNGFPAGTWLLEGVSRAVLERALRGLDVMVSAVDRVPKMRWVTVRRPRIGLYQSWSANMDEGWTRWLLERYGFSYTTLHPQDLQAAATGEGEAAPQIPIEARRMWPPHVAGHALKEWPGGPLRRHFDVLIFPHQNPEEILRGRPYPLIPPVYRPGIGARGLQALRRFINDGGTIVALGNATEFFIREWPIPVRNAVAGLKSNEFLIPGSIVRIQVDSRHPLGWGMPEETWGFFIRNPVFERSEALPGYRAEVVVRYPNAHLRASGWVRGERYVLGRAAVVQIEFPLAPGRSRAGRIVLMGLRPQHRAQTRATFKLLFNALYQP